MSFLHSDNIFIEIIKTIIIVFAANAVGSDVAETKDGRTIITILLICVGTYGLFR